MFALGESVCKVQTPPSPVSVTSELMPSDLAELPGGELLGSPSGGRVHLGRAKVADNYTMGKVLAQGEDYMIVEGFNVKTHRSHALKLLAKSSARLQRRGWLSGKPHPVTGAPMDCEEVRLPVPVRSETYDAPPRHPARLAPGAVLDLHQGRAPELALP